MELQVLILLFSLVIATGGVVAIVQGVRDERRSRRGGSSAGALGRADGADLVAEIEEWLKERS
jgi:hypothetical protein